ncbi:type I iterative polyketide synthase [Penicillium fimorum]|uniref:Type I iterative polyketide synthase n=1 Tax=Penicillium fimorum TaxID=1882269 RepID=A0A9W9XXU3_9EURO|nr:type I iterative polyketide synthase [Penicillium fimorum]
MRKISTYGHAAPGQVLKRVPYHPNHERFMNIIIYGLLEKDARLIDINGSTITRTAVAPSTASADTLPSKLLQDKPVHAAEHKLAALVGQKFADLITDKEDGLKLIFGTPESREIAADMYSHSPVNTVWIKQLEQFFERVLGRLPKDGEPICILEVGGGTGGTTSRIVPLLAKLAVPVKYTMANISGSLIAAARKRFKKYAFIEFQALNMEKMTEQVPWCDFIFGLLEGWWLFEDGRDYVLQPAIYWEKVLHSVGYGHVDWTEGELPEARTQRLIIADASGSSAERWLTPLLTNTQKTCCSITHFISYQVAILEFWAVCARYRCYRKPEGPTSWPPWRNVQISTQWQENHSSPSNLVQSNLSAKLVTERILAETLYRFPEWFHVMAVRIAQITGLTSNGYWNPSEYMPFLIKSSQVLKILPDLDGTLSWYPVNDIAAVLGELLLSQSTTDLIYHIDSPSRQSWREMIAILARTLDLGQKSIVSFAQWVNRVRDFRGSTTDHPALQLIDFFDHYFVPMSCGGLVLDTTKSSQYSKTLQNQGLIDEDLMMEYIATWKESGFLDP